MRHNLLLLALVPCILAGCYPTRIVTTAPVPYGNTTEYSTVVTYPKTRTTTTTTQVYAKSYDISLQLDLQAVAAAFAQSSTVKEFESLLNNASYIISNLDLNNDGYVDYLRVLETVEGYDHVFLIQAVLAPNVFQDVATIVVENPSYFSDYHIEIVGSPFIYGPNYIVRPIFIQRPYVLTYLCRAGYQPWHSPWYWAHFPSYYKHPAPVFLNHYQAYIRTYMTNHVYCHEVMYPDRCHYQHYERVCKPMSCNDYAKSHPSEAFTVRNANVVTAGAGSRTVTNARDIRAINDATKTTTTATTASRNSSATRSSSVTSTKSTGSATAASRSSSTTASEPVRSASTSGTVSGTTATRSSSTAGTTASTPSATRSSSTSGSTTAARSSSTVGSSTAAASSSRSASTSSAPATRSSGSTTTSSRVRTSGSSATRTTTVNESGSQTVRRGSESASRSSSASNSTATRSGSTSSSSAGATRSSSTAESSSTSSVRGTRR